MRLLTQLLLLAIFSACGTAKTAYRDTRYDLCMQKCKLKYGQYESTKMSQCTSECMKEKYKQD